MIYYPWSVSKYLANITRSFYSRVAFLSLRLLAVHEWKIAALSNTQCHEIASPAAKKSFKGLAARSHCISSIRISPQVLTAGVGSRQTEELGKERVQATGCIDTSSSLVEWCKRIPTGAWSFGRSFNGMVQWPTRGRSIRLPGWNPDVSVRRVKEVEQVL